MDVQKAVDTAKDYAAKGAAFLTELEQVLEQLGPVIVVLGGLLQKHFGSPPNPPTPQ